MKIRIKPARAAFCAAVAAALSFGTSQAFARSYPPLYEGEHCLGRVDNQLCYEGCVAIHGPNTQGTCSGEPFTLGVCQCFR